MCLALTSSCYCHNGIYYLDLRLSNVWVLQLFQWQGSALNSVKFLAIKVELGSVSYHWPEYASNTKKAQPKARSTCIYFVNRLMLATRLDPKMLSGLNEHHFPWTPPWWSAYYCATACSRACQNQSQPIHHWLLPSLMSLRHPAGWGSWWCGERESAQPPWRAAVGVPRWQPQWPPWQMPSCCCWSEEAAGRGSHGDEWRQAVGGEQLVSCPADLARWQGETAPVSSGHLNPGETLEKCI